MTQQEIEEFVIGLENVQREENMGYIFFFVGENHFIPFTTIGYADNPGDNVSNLNREGVFRVNMGVSKASFDSLFADSTPDNPIDYSALDVFMPHPHYAKQGYICILNPSAENEAQVKKFILEAHSIAMTRSLNTFLK
jgi:hypothetical protein